MTTLESEKIFDRPEPQDEGFYGLSGPMDGEGANITSSVVHRKKTVQNVTTQDLDFEHQDDNSGDYDDDDYDEEEQGLLNPIHREPAFSFQIKSRNATYNISFPSFETIKYLIQTTDYTPVYKICWIMISLYVMTETMRRFDNHTGAFSGKTAAERVHINPHAGEHIHAVTSYGGEQPINGVQAPGLTVSAPQTSSFQQVQDSLQNLDQNQNFQQNESQTMMASNSQPTMQSNSINTGDYETILKNQSPFATLPPMLQENLSDLTTPMSLKETPMFWHIPRSGGTTIKTLLGTCLQQVVASEVGVMDGHDKDTTLEVIHRERPAGKFVNVDTMSIPGLERAKSLNLAKSGLAQVMSTIHFNEASDLFTQSDHHARWFAILRHPVERAVSMFHHMDLMNAWGPNFEITIDAYVDSDKVESNWMVRYLTGKKHEDVGLEDLNVAKEILRKKFLVGLFDKMDSSFDRFEYYYGWRAAGEDQRECVDRLLHKQFIGKNEYPEISKASPVWNKLEKINNWDMKLYDYAVQLFREQETLMGS